MLRQRWNNRTAPRDDAQSHGNRPSGASGVQRRRRIRLGLIGLGFGYFLWYVPYSSLTKALSSGLLPVAHQPILGFKLLPAAALGTLLSMPVFLAISGWWRHAGQRRLLGVQVPFPQPHTAMAAIWMALIMGTTTLNFALPGVTILFMLIMMRIEMLLISPAIDLIRRHKINPWSWTASILALVSAVVALADVHNYKLSVAAVASLLAYAAGYTGRFAIMSRTAKSGQHAIDRRYFVEEHMTTPFWLVGLLGLCALIGQGQALEGIRAGFTSFLLTPAALVAMLIGVLYEGLFIFTTLIYLDPREYTVTMPANVSSSLLAGVAGSFLLHWGYDLALPGAPQFASAGIILLAVVALSYPGIMKTLALRRLAAMQAALAGKRVLLFVCGGNTCRSPMAEAIARAELASASADGAGWGVLSAGLSARPGALMTRQAAQALRALGVSTGRHLSRALTSELIAHADAVYCMTSAQREAVLEMVPEAADKVFCLDPDGDIPDPIGQAAEVYRHCAARIRTRVRQRLAETGSYPMPEVGGAL
jgi:protein-tyrosine-phosphatase